MNTEKTQCVWADWKLTELLSETSTTRVYKALKTEYGVTSESAIMIISVSLSELDLSPNMSDEERLLEASNDFAKELVLTKKLNGATNIVAIEDHKIVNRTDGFDVYIRMELLVPLTQKLTALTREDIIKIGIDICTALELCSKYNIIHGDIKPENIFISPFGDYKLGGLGRTSGISGGTAAKDSSFAAPEVIKGIGHDATADIYSLGMVLYTLLNNNLRPFVSPEFAYDYAETAAANERRLRGEDLPPPCNADTDLAQVILTACSFDSKRRFKNPAAFKRALMSCKRGTVTVIPQKELDMTVKVSAAPKAVKEAAPKKKKGVKALIIILIILILLAGAALSFLIISSRSRDESETPDKEKQRTEKAHDKESEREITSETTVDITETTAEPITETEAAETTAPIPETEPETTAEPEPEKEVFVAEKTGSVGSITWEYGDGALIFGGSGAIPDYTLSSYAPWTGECEIITKVIIGDGITKIGNCAFAWCDTLVSVTIPETVTEIGTSAFYKCAFMKNITIPSSVTKIGNSAFTACYDLKNIYCSGNSCFTDRDGVLFTADMKKLVSYPAGRYDKEYSIPDGVETLGYESFCWVDRLETINIPSSVTAIEDYVFFGCLSLDDVYIPSSVILIKEGSFCDCAALTNIEMYDNGYYMSEDGVLFNSGMSRLIAYPAGKEDSYYTLPASVYSIGCSAFSGCENLYYLDADYADVTSIGTNAFYEMNHLTIYCEEGSLLEKYSK
ncbi:MAG: hypothetical protein E7652_01025 [Ruminococcaceae bacterium]|nr:hypothetical protein [Oscillospiraceae bacterium]